MQLLAIFQIPGFMPKHGNFQNYHIWASKLEFEKKGQKLHMDPLSTPGQRFTSYSNFDL